MYVDRNKIKTTVLTVASIGCIVVLWASMRTEPMPVNVATPAVAEPEVAKLPMVETPVAFKAIKTYPQSVKRKLGLPEPVQANDAKQVIDASRLPADDHTQTLITVIDLNAGTTETFVRRNPNPMFALDYSGDAGMYLGFKNGVPAIRLEARQSFMAIEDIKIGGIVSLDQPISSMLMPPSTFLGLGGWGHWK